MEQTTDSSDDGLGPRPPPYSPQDSYTGTSYQLGKEGIVVVCPPGPYDNNNMAHPEQQQSSPTPPQYTDNSQSIGFSDAAVRRGFIRKVYLTLMIQLLATVGIICAFLYWESLKEWTLENDWFSYTMMSAVVVLILALSCCGNLRRRVPINFIALGLFTIAEGLMLGSVTVYYNAEAVMWAVGATAFVSLTLTVFAMQTRWDFTAASGSLWVFAWTLFSFAMLCAILRSQFLYILYACLGTLLFSLYLVFDTQAIIGGKHKKLEVSPEEYVFAALNLYVDVVSLFLIVLQFVGLCR